MSPAQITYKDLPSHCLSRHASKPVDFGSKQKEQIQELLSACLFEQLEQSPYWISQYGSGVCRTITFSKHNVSIEENVSCTSVMHPICETNKSLCHLPANNTLKFDEWIDIGKNDTSYLVSENRYTYCEAKQLCETTWYGTMVTPNDNLYMPILASKLGLTGMMTLEIWLKNSGITCPQNNGSGNTTVFTGPYVQVEQARKANARIKMLCERKTSTILTTSPSTAKWHSTWSHLPQQISSLRPTTQRQHPLSFTTYGSSPLESTPQRQTLSDSTTASQKSQWHSTQQQQAKPQWQSHSSSQFGPQWQPEPEAITAMLALSKMSAYMVTDNELDETDVHLIPYKNEPVQFKLTKENVQSMWRHLRQQRNPSQ
ncbi:uncharacterized protein LOC132726899 [Ruditapes philippinarum]|uniref:uncharacterized protein LOC132726899 n=1 Tax=Ruditapes philippinarum TaxID=129788 RepID=UPI00295AF020|nr:uncharacterized protein LOC132726899 [Ruditapes philippinarum]